MAYTVISMFPANVNAEEVKKELQNQGFDEADIIVSKSKLENESSEGYEDDEKTKSFWDHIFINEVELLSAYREGSIGKVCIVVYTDSVEEARKAKTVLNEHGAIEVKKEPSDHNHDAHRKEENKDTAGLPEDVYNGIIAKARHNVYFLDSERVYRPNSRGMDARTDNLGSKD